MNVSDLEGSIRILAQKPDETNGQRALDSLREAVTALESDRSLDQQARVLFCLLGLGVRTNISLRRLLEATFTLSEKAAVRHSGVTDGTPAAVAQEMSVFARSVSDLATPKQIVLIRSLCRDLDVEPKMELEKMFQVKGEVEELSRRAASTMIDDLKGRSAGIGDFRA